jgi:hypothetical protein
LSTVRSSTTISLRSSPLTLISVGIATATAALAGSLGADSRWLAALGRSIVEKGSIPDGVPYAAANSHDWPNTLAFSELIFYGLDHVGGERGLLLAQVVAVAVAFLVLGALLLRTGATDASAAMVLVVVAAGSLGAIAVVRVQLFSLLLFPVVLTLLHREARAPSRAVWLLVPLAALWSSLHGAVLVGVAVAGSYLILDRLRREPRTALAVLAASVLALALTPTLERTPGYYAGVFENEAARRAYGLWAPLGVGGFDLLLIVAAAVLLVLAVRARPAPWELAALAGLAVLTVRSGRIGVWLLFVAAVPAARGLAVRFPLRPRLAAVGLAATALLAAIGVADGPLPVGGSDGLIRQAIAESRGTPILADSVLAEQVALAGGRVWMANPLDAFERRDQRTYLDWLQGHPGGARALAESGRVVLVRKESDLGRHVARDRALRQVAADDYGAAYVKRG